MEEQDPILKSLLKQKNELQSNSEKLKIIDDNIKHIDKCIHEIRLAIENNKNNYEKNILIHYINE